MSEIVSEIYNNNDGRFFDIIYKSIDESIKKKDRNNIEERIVSEILTWLRKYEKKYSLEILGLFYYNPTIIQHEGIDPSSIEKYKQMFNDSLYFLEDMFIHSERYNIYYLKNIFNNFLEFHKKNQNGLYAFIGALSHCIDDSIKLRESWGSEPPQESINLILYDIGTSIHNIFNNRQDEFNKSFEEPNTDTNSYQEILDKLQMLQKKSDKQDLVLKQQAKRMKILESRSFSSSCSSNSSSCSSNSSSCSSNSSISINTLQEKLSQQEQLLARISELESAVSSSSSSSDRNIIKGVVTSIGNCKQDVDDLKKGQLTFAMDLGQKFVDFKTKCEGELEGLKSTYLEHNKQIETHVGKVLKVVEIVKENKLVAEQKISEIDSILVDINSSKESISNFVPDSTIKFEEFIGKNQELFQQSLDRNQQLFQQSLDKNQQLFQQSVSKLEDSDKKRKRENKVFINNLRNVLATLSDEEGT